MHDCLTGLPEWQQQQQRLAEVEELHGKYAARDLQVAAARRREQETYRDAYRAAVEAGQEPPSPPPEPRLEPSRAQELARVRIGLLDEQRALMNRLRRQVVARAEAREAELLEQARDTKTVELEPIRAELQAMATTLRMVLTDGPTYRTDVDVADVVLAALDGGSCLWLPADEAAVTIHSSRVHVDRDPSPTVGEVHQMVRLADSDRIRRDMLGRGA